MDLGGFKSEEYLAVNPQGKVPALKCQESGLAIAESDTVSRYLLSEFAALEPSFQPDNPKSNLMSRFNDIYINSIQGCLYKVDPPFGSFGTRRDALEEFSKQLYVIAEMMDPTGPYLCGSEVSLADATIFPTIVFAAFMFPKFDHGIERAIPEKLEAWFQRMQDTESSFRKVYDEVWSELILSGCCLEFQVHCILTRSQPSVLISDYTTTDDGGSTKMGREGTVEPDSFGWSS